MAPPLVAAFPAGALHRTAGVAFRASKRPIVFYGSSIAAMKRCAPGVSLNSRCFVLLAKKEPSEPAPSDEEADVLLLLTEEMPIMLAEFPKPRVFAVQEVMALNLFSQWIGFADEARKGIFHPDQFVEGCIKTEEVLQKYLAEVYPADEVLPGMTNELDKFQKCWRVLVELPPDHPKELPFTLDERKELLEHVGLKTTQYNDVITRIALGFRVVQRLVDVLKLSHKYYGDTLLISHGSAEPTTTEKKRAYEYLDRKIISLLDELVMPGTYADIPKDLQQHWGRMCETLVNFRAADVFVRSCKDLDYALQTYIRQIYPADGVKLDKQNVEVDKYEKTWQMIQNLSFWDARDLGLSFGDAIDLDFSVEEKKELFESVDLKSKDYGNDEIAWMALGFRMVRQKVNVLNLSYQYYTKADGAAAKPANQNAGEGKEGKEEGNAGAAEDGEGNEGKEKGIISKEGKEEGITSKEGKEEGNAGAAEDGESNEGKEEGFTSKEGKEEGITSKEGKEEGNAGAAGDGEGNEGKEEGNDGVAEEAEEEEDPKV